MAHGRLARGALLLIAGLMMSSIETGCASTPKAPPPFLPREWVGAWVKMWNTYDLTRVDQLFLEDEKKTTYFSSETERLISGIDEVREHHRGFGFVEGGKSVDAELWVEDLQARVHGGTVVVTGIWFFRRGPEGESPVQRGPVTIVYHWAGPDLGYRIVHSHFANYPDAEAGRKPAEGDLPGAGG